MSMLPPNAPRRTEAYISPGPVRATVGSENLLKLTAVRQGISRSFPGRSQETLFFDVDHISVLQPMDEQTMYDDAYNRAIAAIEAAQMGASATVATNEQFSGLAIWNGFGFGLASGLYQHPRNECWYASASVVVVNSATRESHESSITPLEIGGHLLELIQGGQELSVAAQEITRYPVTETRDAYTALSGGAIKAGQVYADAVAAALMPFAHPEYYMPTSGISER